MLLADARVLITGSSCGIGASVARLAAARGARVLLHGRDEDRLRELAGELAPSVAGVLVADLAELPGAAGLAGLAMATGPVDVLVHCAGVGWRGGLADMPAADAEQLLRVNLHAPVELTRLLLPDMLAAGHGHLAFVGSIAGLIGVAGEAVYSASKGGLAVFADALVVELAGTGVTVSSLAPGAVDTEFWTSRGAPYGRRFPRLVSAERVAEAVVRDIERGHGSRTVPTWLAVAPAVRAVVPGLYRRLSQRFG